MALIEVENLSVTFSANSRQVRAVENVSLTVGERESFGLVGESGSGKSTILRAICGLAPISEGSIRIKGEPVKTPRGKAFSALVQMVFQDPYASLHPRHTIDRTLSEPLAIHGIPDTDKRVMAALTDVGLPTSFRFRYPHQLSGGQRQRVAIARALMLKPAILLLDEPTSALDASVQAETLNLLSRLRDERGLTFLMVSHDLAVIDHMCDRILVMQNGRAVEELSRETLASAQMTTEYARSLFTASADRMLEGGTPHSFAPEYPEGGRESETLDPHPRQVRAQDRFEADFNPTQP